MGYQKTIRPVGQVNEKKHLIRSLKVMAILALFIEATEQRRILGKMIWII